MKYSLSLLLVLLAVSPFAAATEKPLIVGGSEIAGTHPIARSTVALVVGNSLCTGSIVDRDLVVTAAHCLYGFSGKVGVVFSTSLAKISKGTVMAAARFVVHPDYDPAKTHADQNDIGLIQLSGPLPAGYAPVALLPEGTPLKKGETVILAGYGISDASAKTGAGILRAAEVTVLNEQLGRTEAVLDQTHGAGACHGDSGGPAFLTLGGRLYLWGVTSRGYPNRSLDDCAHDVVYTQIGEQMRFLESAASALKK